MPSFDYDLFVIGAGSGGVRAARISAGYGAKVAIVEERDLGGTCVNVGCVPKKLLVYASHFGEERHDAVAGFGWSSPEPSFDWSTLIANKDREIGRLNGIYADLLDGAGVDRIEGRATITGAHEVDIAGRRISAKHILVAVGGWPSKPDLPGIEHAITSNEVFHLKDMPQRVVIVGGGYIAVEFAGIFHGLGADVIQLYRGPLFLRGFDDDVREALAVEMRQRGIDLRFDSNAAAIEKTKDGLRVTLTDGSSLECDEVLYATGRHPLTEGIGLESVGVETDAKGAVVVDEFSCTSVPSIHAIGDVTDRVNLTPVALHEGMCLAKTLFAGEPTRPVHEDIASAVFSQPPIGTVGLSETDARERYADIDVYVSQFRPLKHTLTGAAEKTLMKLIVDRASDRVIGIHVLGPDAGEIIQGFAVAVKCRATKAQFDATIGIHPTSAEELVTMRDPRAS